MTSLDCREPKGQWCPFRTISKETLMCTPSTRLLELACPKWPYFVYYGSDKFRFIPRPYKILRRKVFGYGMNMPADIPSLKEIGTSEPGPIIDWQEHTKKEPKLITFPPIPARKKLTCPKRVAALAKPRHNWMEIRKKQLEEQKKVYTVSRCALKSIPSARTIALARHKDYHRTEAKCQNKGYLPAVTGTGQGESRARKELHEGKILALPSKLKSSVLELLTHSEVMVPTTISQECHMGLGESPISSKEEKCINLKDEIARRKTLIEANLSRMKDANALGRTDTSRKSTHSREETKTPSGRDKILIGPGKLHKTGSKINVRIGGRQVMDQVERVTLLGESSTAQPLQRSRGVMATREVSTVCPLITTSCITSFADSATTSHENQMDIDLTQMEIVKTKIADSVSLDDKMENSKPVSLPMIETYITSQSLQKIRRNDMRGKAVESKSYKDAGFPPTSRNKKESLIDHSASIAYPKAHISLPVLQRQIGIDAKFPLNGRDKPEEFIRLPSIRERYKSVQRKSKESNCKGGKNGKLNKNETFAFVSKTCFSDSLYDSGKVDVSSVIKRGTPKSIDETFKRKRASETRQKMEHLAVGTSYIEKPLRGDLSKGSILPSVADIQSGRCSKEPTLKEGTHTKNIKSDISQLGKKGIIDRPEERKDIKNAIILPSDAKSKGDDSESLIVPKKHMYSKLILRRLEKDYVEKDYIEENDNDSATLSDGTRNLDQLLNASKTNVEAENSISSFVSQRRSVIDTGESTAQIKMDKGDEIVAASLLDKETAQPNQTHLQTRAYEGETHVAKETNVLAEMNKYLDNLKDIPTERLDEEIKGKEEKCLSIKLQEKEEDVQSKLERKNEGMARKEYTKDAKYKLTLLEKRAINSDLVDDSGSTLERQTRIIEDYGADAELWEKESEEKIEELIKTFKGNDTAVEGNMEAKISITESFKEYSLEAVMGDKQTEQDKGNEEYLVSTGNLPKKLVTEKDIITPTTYYYKEKGSNVDTIAVRMEKKGSAETLPIPQIGIESEPEPLETVDAYIVPEVAETFPECKKEQEIELTKLQDIHSMKMETTNYSVRYRTANYVPLSKPPSPLNADQVQGKISSKIPHIMKIEDTGFNNKMSDTHNNETKDVITPSSKNLYGTGIPSISKLGKDYSSRDHRKYVNGRENDTKRVAAASKEEEMVKKILAGDAIKLPSKKKVEKRKGEEIKKSEGYTKGRYQNAGRSKRKSFPNDLKLMLQPKGRHMALYSPQAMLSTGEIFFSSGRILRKISKPLNYGSSCTAITKPKRHLPEQPKKPCAKIEDFIDTSTMEKAESNNVPEHENVGDEKSKVAVLSSPTNTRNQITYRESESTDYERIQAEHVIAYERETGIEAVTYKQTEEKGDISYKGEKSVKIPLMVTQVREIQSKSVYIPPSVPFFQRKLSYITLPPLDCPDVEEPSEAKGNDTAEHEER